MQTPHSTSALAAVEDDHGGDEAYRSLPHNIEAEQALLGAILVNNEAANKVAGFLLPEHFFEPVHGRIFAAALGLVERGLIATPITLKTYFERDEALGEVGGAQYLARLAGAAVSIINAEDYGRTIHDLALRRQLIQLGEDVVNQAFDAEVAVSALDQIEEAEQGLFNLAERGQYEGGFQAFTRPLTDAITTIEAAHKHKTGLTGVATDLVDLDNLLGGLHRADLVILAGRPSMGKTALATNIAFNAARARRDSDGGTGAVIGFFSLEMSAEQLAMRMLSEESGIGSEDLRRGKLSDSQFVDVVRASQDLDSVPFFIDDTPALSVAALRTRARRLKRTQHVSMIVVDYLQLVRPATRSRSDNRVQEVTEITQGLKALAKELDVPVLALSQLSRAVEQREDKRPQLSDLRESGSIEQDADVVMFIYREEYYLSRGEPKPRAEESDDRFHDRYLKWQERLAQATGITEIIVAKQRHGPTGNVKLYFEAGTTKFGNLEKDHLGDNGH